MAFRHVVGFTAIAFGCLAGLPAHAQQYTGIAAASAEYGETALPGEYGRDYRYPNAGELRGLIETGANTVRLPVRWERLQHALEGPLEPNELQRLTAAVDTVTAAGATIVIDVHNYARYHGAVIGDGVPIGALADLWSRLAGVFGSRERVVFGLMNEPHDMDTTTWIDAAQQAVDAIRERSDNLILIPGNHWTGAHSWSAQWTGLTNAKAMLKIVGSNVAFELHAYLDDDASGDDDSCPRDGAADLAGVTAWARRHGKRVFLGEFGVGAAAECLSRLDAMLEHMGSADDVWIGWVYWVYGGPWWTDPKFGIDPATGAGSKQLEVLQKHFSGATVASPSTPVEPEPVVPLTPEASSPADVP